MVLYYKILPSARQKRAKPAEVLRKILPATSTLVFHLCFSTDGSLLVFILVFFVLTKWKGPFLYDIRLNMIRMNVAWPSGLSSCCFLVFFSFELRNRHDRADYRGKFIGIWRPLNRLLLFCYEQRLPYMIPGICFTCMHVNLYNYTNISFHIYFLLVRMSFSTFFFF